MINWETTKFWYFFLNDLSDYKKMYFQLASLHEAKKYMSKPETDSWI